MDFKQRFVVLDIETTGLNYEYWDEPTEIALIEIINGKITGKQKHFYLKPYKGIDLKFLESIFGKSALKKLKVSSIDLGLKKLEKELRNEPIKKKIEELKELEKELLKSREFAKDMYSNVMSGQNKYNVLPEVKNFIGDSIVIGHNASFDVNFLNYWFSSLRIPLIKKYICTMKNYKKHFNFKKNNLASCCEYYSISLEGAHNAYDDTRACAELFLKEIEEFPDEIICEDFSDIEAYVNFKKRVLNTTYFRTGKIQLECEFNIPENIESLSEVEIMDCENLFFNFKKPIEVHRITGLDLESVEAIFIDWVNCININKHLDIIKDKYLYSTINEILWICERNFDKIRELNLLLLNKEPNFFLYKLIDKLENKKDKMEYNLDDFDYYFKNNKSISELSKKTGKSMEYIIDFLLDWINVNVDRIEQYELLFKKNYKTNTSLCKSELEKVITKSINKSKNKDFILKNMKI